MQRARKRERRRVTLFIFIWVRVTKAFVPSVGLETKGVMPLQSVS